MSTDGYFDVYPHAARRPNDRPAYRGVISELGQSVRGTDGRLSVRPDSVALEAAVSVWARERGVAAARGDLGLGRTTGHDAPPKPGAVAARPAAKPEPRPAAKPEPTPELAPDAAAEVRS